ncbi:AAA family ATPase [Amycolatopsis magusensis]|uniref:Tetratricopeptide (TPR) repeat protein n=1 Tax=Amycolatopsis magusensis TaxID=882444 RepID=A0ABS4PXM5_9PSEU|nr:AAA family ATPase [Amycolatopsis magusensis]MBP2184187.1 tetratricopeptide (TPR) repeat protein [Amycolatopsis magusensis]MDI5975747.1 AAA family ATPase [Amycolatopsis magusensis]
MSRAPAGAVPGLVPRELPLVDREAELEVLTSAVTGLAAGRSAYVQVSGPPGVGRTALLRQAMAVAAGEDVRVLHAAGVPHAPGDPGAGNDVVGAFASGLPAGFGGGSPTSVAALCEDFVAAARQCPLMLVLDDAQWMDDRSWLWLRAMLRRLNWGPLLVVVAVNELGMPAESLAEFGAEATVHEAPRHVLRLGLLSTEGIRRLLALGQEHPADRDTAAEVRLVTRGVPSVVRAALHAGAPDLTTGAAEARGDWVGRVMRVLAPEPTALARTAAVCGDDFDWQLVCAVSGLPPAVAARAAGLLRRLGLADDGGPANPVRFTEPVVVERVLAGMPTEERAELFRRVLALGLRAGAEPAFLARVALSAPAGSAGVERLLYGEARRLHAQRAHEDAARLLERALREPSSEAAKARLMVELAGVESVTAPEASDRRLVRVLLGGSHVSPELRLRAADMLVSQGRPSVARRTLTAAARMKSLPEDERGMLAAMCRLAEETIPELDEYTFGTAPVPGEPPDTPASAGVAAWLLAVRGQDRDRALTLARTSLDVPRRSDHPVSPRLLACAVLMLGGAAEEAERSLDALVVEARRRGMRAAAVWAMLTRGSVALVRERWDEAAQYFDWMAQELPEPGWHPMVAGHARALTVTLHLQRGRPDEARRCVDEPLPPGVEHSMGGAQALFASGLVRLADGAPADALELFLESGRRMLARQWVNPVLLSWRVLAGIAQQACGRPEEAKRLVLEERSLAERWGEPGYVERVKGLGEIVLSPS